MNNIECIRFGTVPFIVFFCLSLSACSEEKPQAAESPTVIFQVVKETGLTLTRELPGRVSAYQVAEVRPQVSGIIQQRLFEEGSDVETGQVLYQIDPALHKAAYKNAEATLKRAEANLVTSRLLSHRYDKLVITNAISKQERDDAAAAYLQAQADVEAAKASLETAGINLDYTKVTAPVSGRISRSFITVGALATQNQAAPLATIQQLDPVYVDVTQSNTELLKLREDLEAGRLRSSDADSAKLKLKLESGTPYARNVVNVRNGEAPDWLEGDLLFSDVTIEPSTGVVSLRAAFDNPAKVLLPGMYVRAVLEEGVREDAILVPQRALMRDTRGRPIVYILTPNKPAIAGNDVRELKPGEYWVEARIVVIDRSHGNNWILSDGLRPDELLLVEGLTKVRPGQIAVGQNAVSQPTALVQPAQNQDVR